MSTGNVAWGVEFTMEAIFQNYIIYQYALDQYWSMSSVKPSTHGQWCTL